MSKKFLLFIFSVLVILTGCASPQEITRFKEQLNYLEESNKNLERHAVLQDSLLQEQLSVLQRMRADLSSTTGNVDERLSIVINKLEDSSQRFSDLFQRMDQFKQPTFSPDTSMAKDSSQVQIELDPQKLYDAAYVDLTKGNYDLAISGFSQYLKYFPNNQLTDNAQYWMGECYYAKGDFQKGAIEFKKVVTNFPKGDKVPAALYKLGLSFKNLNNKPQAIKSFQDLIKQYPQAEEAALAKERLRELKK